MIHEFDDVNRYVPAAGILLGSVLTALRRSRKESVKSGIVGLSALELSPR